MQDGALVDSEHVRIWNIKWRVWVIELREDLVLLKQIEDKAPGIILVGDRETPKKYHDIVVVQVGDAVKKYKPGDKVIVMANLMLIPLDPFDTGIKTPHAIVTEGSLYGRIF